MHMGKIREIKKDESFQQCQKFGKPGSVTGVCGGRRGDLLVYHVM